MRLLCDREDAQPCPWTSHNPTEVLSHNMSCWIYLPLSVSSSHPLSLCLSLLPLLSSLTVIQDCQTESETSRQTAQRGLQKHGGVVSKVKQSCRARRQLLTSQQKHASHCHLSFLLFLIHGLHFTNTRVSGEQYILGKSWTIILEKINLSKHRIRYHTANINGSDFINIVITLLSLLLHRCKMGERVGFRNVHLCEFTYA